MITDTPTDSREILYDKPVTSNTEKLSLEYCTNVHLLSEMYERTQSFQLFDT